jgi:hypothetical protein
MNDLLVWEVWAGDVVNARFRYLPDAVEWVVGQANSYRSNGWKDTSPTSRGFVATKGDYQAVWTLQEVTL